MYLQFVRTLYHNSLNVLSVRLQVIFTHVPSPQANGYSYTLTLDQENILLHLLPRYSSTFPLNRLGHFSRCRFFWSNSFQCRWNWLVVSNNYLYLIIVICLLIIIFSSLGSIPDQFIPKTQKMVLDATLLNAQHY